VKIMSSIFRVLTIIAAATAMSIAAWGQSASSVTVYEGARVIVGDGSAPIENATFVVDGTRIVQVGRSGQVRGPSGAARIDLQGKTVMPAIIDTHTHMPNARDELVDALRRKAYYGVSAVMSLGQDAGDLAYQVRAEPITGAALLRTAGRGITMPEPGRSEVPYWISTEAEARKAVGELAARKADIVKIWVDDREGTYKKLTPELYGAIIDEAHKQGLRVTAHIFYLDDAKGLLRAGIDAFAHGVRDKEIDDELLALVKQRPGFVLVPNMGERGVATDLSWLAASLPDAEFKKLQAASTDRPALQASYAIQARNLARMNAAGVKIALGTDGNISWAHHLEMEDMVLAGMTPQQVIVAATGNAAEFMRLNDRGTIAAGKVADFLVLDANPLEDIKNTRKISTVYLQGSAINRASLPSR
jgi:imidazolonepropionase-like amidohydrolase